MAYMLPVGYVCLAEVSRVSPSSEQTGELWANQCLNSWLINLCRIEKLSFAIG